MSSPLAVSCPNCGAGLKLKNRNFVGKKVPCPKCKEPFLVEEPPEDEFLAEDDFGGEEAQEEQEEESPRAKKGGKGGKGKKKSKGGGGSGAVLMVGGIVLGIALLGGIVYGAMKLLSGRGGGSSDWTAWMPEDTDILFRVRPNEITNSQFLKPIMEHPTLSKLANMPAPPGQGNGPDALAAALNLSMRDIDSITIGGKGFANGGNESKGVFAVVRTKTPIESSKLDQAASVLTKETHSGKSVYGFNNSTPKLLLYPASTDTFVLGADADVRAAIDRNGAGPGSRFELSDSNAQVFICMAPKDPSAFKDSSPSRAPFGTPFQFGTKTKEADLKSMTIGVNFNSDASVTMVMNSLDTFNTQVQTDLLKSEIEQAKKELAATGGGLIDPTAGLKSHVKAMLDSANVSVSGKTATVTMSLSGKIVSDGLVLAAPFMPMLDQMVANQQAKAATASSSSNPGMSSPGMMMGAPGMAGPPGMAPAGVAASSHGSSGGSVPGGITAYPGAVINAGNSAQNRIGNIQDQHNSAIASQMQEGAAAAGHGDSSGGGFGLSNLPAALPPNVAAAGANGAAAGHGDSSAGFAGGPPPGVAAGPPGVPGGAAAGHGDSSAAAGGPNMEQMRRQMQGGPPGVPGGAAAGHGDSSAAGFPGAGALPPPGAGGQSGPNDEQMRRQMQGGGPPGVPGGGAPGGPDANRAAMEEQMRRQMQGGPPAGAGGGPNQAAMQEQMRRQMQGGGAGFGGIPNAGGAPNAPGQPGAEQPGAGQPNGNGNEAPKTKSRSRRRTN